MLELDEVKEGYVELFRLWNMEGGLARWFLAGSFRVSRAVYPQQKIKRSDVKEGEGAYEPILKKEVSVCVL